MARLDATVVRGAHTPALVAAAGALHRWRPPRRGRRRAGWPDD
ncbi:MULTISPECIES: hypothetical protein [unclassified Modestobacter]